MPSLSRPLALASALVLLGLSIPAASHAESVLRRGHQAEPETMDPYKSDGLEEFWIQDDLFEGLTRVDIQGHIVPAVASSWDVAEDGLTWTFHLRPEAKWSDGTPLTAEDFVWSFRRVVDPKTAASYASAFYPIVNAREINDGKEKDLSKLGVTAVDTHTLKISLNEPTGFLDGVLALGIGFPAPRKAIEAHGEEWTRPGNIISNGPYVMTDWVPQQEITMKRNPNFWDAKSVKIDEVRWLVIESDETSFKRFRNGELDMSRIPQPQIAWAKQNMPQELHQDVLLWTAFIYLNCGREPLTDPKLRQALAMVIDRDALADKIDPHGEIPAYNLVPPGMPNYAQQQPDWMKLSKADRLALAKKLYAEAGYGPDKPVKIEMIYPTNESRRKIVTAMMTMWKAALGADIQGQNSENQVVESQQRRHEFQMSLYGWVADYPDPWTFLSVFHSNAGGLNASDYKNPEYDALLDKAKRTISPAERLKLLEEAERILSKDTPIIPLYHDVEPRLVSTKVLGYTGNPLNIYPSRDLALAP